MDQQLYYDEQTKDLRKCLREDKNLNRPKTTHEILRDDDWNKSGLPIEFISQGLERQRFS